MNAPRHGSRVIENRTLAPGSHELVLERPASFAFRAGEEIQVHGAEPADDRTYSLAGGEREGVLRIIFRVIPDGLVTPRLARMKAGDPIDFTGPFGSFTLRDAERPLWFVATGTGIAPLLSFLRTHAPLRPTVLHGVRTEAELYGRDEIEPRCAAYHPCVTRGAGPAMRVTDLLPRLHPPPDVQVYLCGRNEMIQHAQAALRAHGLPADQIFHEPYFFW